MDLIAGDVQLGWPRLAESALALFESEYRLPFLPPELAAPMAALGEHVFPLLILLGLATRFSSLALLGMTIRRRRAQKRRLPDDWARMIYRENAQALYRLD